MRRLIFYNFRNGRLYTTMSKNNSGVAPTPFVEINGKKYHSDRFYLNKPLGSLPYYDNNEGVLFCRAELIASLNLKAAIVGTYVLDPACLKKELPSLFGEDASVPTLLLHGQREFSINYRTSRKSKYKKMRFPSTNNNPNKRMKAENYSTHSTEGETNENFITVDHHKDQVYSRIDVPENDSVEEDSVEKSKVVQPQDELLPAEEGWRHASKHASQQLENISLYSDADNNDIARLLSSDDDDEEEERENIVFNKSVYLTQILTTWIPPSDAFDFRGDSSASCKQDQEAIFKKDFLNKNIMGVSDDIIKVRKHCMGVYHPKFFLLFETSGSLIVVVSTSNLRPQKSIEGSWIQRFYPSSVVETNNSNGGGTDDFGLVLSNFLHAHDFCAEQGGMTPTEFLKSYVRFDTLEDFRSAFAFQQSDVHLIATIPGIYPSRNERSNEEGESNNCLYGPQRVSNILSRLQQHQKLNNKPWFPHGFLSAHDRLILQPTSISGNWNRTNFSDVVRLYLSSGTRNSSSGSRNLFPSGSSNNNMDLLEKADIVWPSLDFFQRCRTEITKYRQPKNLTDSTVDDRALFVCLSSKTFNSLDVAFISRLKQFEPSGCHPFSLCLTPHIKSYARLLEPVIDLCDDADEPSTTTESMDASKSEVICLVDSPPLCSLRFQHKRRAIPVEERFAWFMLTSACLSRGAQGEAVTGNGQSYGQQHSSGLMKYANFELGILFCSRLQGNPSTDRLYVCNSSLPFSEKEYNSGSKPCCPLTTARTIPLPVPYLVRAPSYQKEEDEVDLAVTPFFNEISEGTGAIGHMLLTPLGKQLALSLSQ